MFIHWKHIYFSIDYKIYFYGFISNTNSNSNGNSNGFDNGGRQMLNFQTI